MGSFVSCFSNLLVMLEKTSLWLVCTMLICCLVTTITIVLGFGIGLGYNYCFNGMMTKRYVPASYVHPQIPGWNSGYPYADLNTAPSAISQPPTSPTIATTANPSPTVDTTSDSDTTPSVPPQTSAAPQTSSGESRRIATISYRLLSNETTISELITELIPESTHPDEYYEEELPEQEPTPEPSEAKSSSEYVNDDEKLKSRYSLVRKKFENITEDDNTTSVTILKRAINDVQKIIIPINGLDLIGLLTQLRDKSRNYTVQIVTT